MNAAQSSDTKNTAFQSVSRLGGATTVLVYTDCTIKYDSIYRAASSDFLRKCNSKECSASSISLLMALK